MTTTHPWITELSVRLDALEAALLSGDASEVERASAQVLPVLKAAPKSAEFGLPNEGLLADMQQQAQRFAQLRQAVMRTQAQSDRALRNLMPDQVKMSTYERMGAVRKNSRPSQAFLSA